VTGKSLFLSRYDLIQCECYIIDTVDNVDNFELCLVSRIHSEYIYVTQVDYCLWIMMTIGSVEFLLYTKSRVTGRI
jgi:hypothetical protein